MLKNSFKIVGIWLLVLTFLAAIAINFIISKTWDSSSIYAITLEILGFISLVLIAFSEEKTDDEFLTHLRVKSIKITVLFSFTYAVLDSFFFEVHHLLIMEVFQIQLLIYIIVFHLLKKVQ